MADINSRLLNVNLNEPIFSLYRMQVRHSAVWQYCAIELLYHEFIISSLYFDYYWTQDYLRAFVTTVVKECVVEPEVPGTSVILYQTDVKVF